MTYHAGTLLELTEWALKRDASAFPRGFYLVISANWILFPNGESVCRYEILFPDGTVERGIPHDGWIRKALREVNPKDYE